VESGWNPAKAGEDLVETIDIGRHDRHAGVDCQDGRAFLEGPDVARSRQSAFGKDHDRPTMGEMLLQTIQGGPGAARAGNRKGVDQQLRQHRLPFALEDGVGGSDHEGAETETVRERLQHDHGIEGAAVVGDEDGTAFDGLDSIAVDDGEGGEGAHQGKDQEGLHHGPNAADRSPLSPRWDGRRRRARGFQFPPLRRSPS